MSSTTAVDAQRFTFNDSGTKAYFLERRAYNAKYLRSGTLSTAYDIDTFSLDSAVGPNILNKDITCYDDQHVLVGSSTTKMWTMSTPGDVSTATNTSSISTPSWRSATISRDGLTLYYSYSLSYLYKADLSTAWDLSTAGSFSGTTSLNSFTNHLRIDGPSSDRDDYMYSAQYSNEWKRYVSDGSGYYNGSNTATGATYVDAPANPTPSNTSSYFMGNNRYYSIEPIDSGTKMLLGYTIMSYGDIFMVAWPTDGT